MDRTFENPIDLLFNGLPITSKIVAMFNCEILIMMYQGLVTIEQRAGINDYNQYCLVLTAAGLKYLQEKLSRHHAEVLELVNKNAPSENTKTPVVDIPTGMKRFREIQVGARFSILAGRGQHKLKFRKVNDTEEDNAFTDAENPEACTFPEDQLVFLVS